MRAVLAGALVLGVGSTMTLAAWTDSEFASGSFTASRFDTESSADGATFASNVNPPVATFTAATGMSPTVSRFTTLDVRTTALTSVGGSVLLTATGKTGTLGDVLEYRVIRAATTTTTCNAGAFNDVAAVFVAGTAGPAYVTAGTMPASPPSQSITAAGGQVRYCFDVRIKSGTANSYQGAAGTLTWTFTSTSTS